MASRVCWNCEKDAHQTLKGDPFYAAGPVVDPTEWFGFFRCDFCGFGSIGQIDIERDEVQRSTAWRYDEATVDANVVNAVKTLLNHPDANVRWLPEHVLGRRFDDVPEWIADAASEAYACYSIRSYRAAILLARSVVEAVANDKGITTGNLAGKIDSLADAGHIRALIQSSAHEIRHLGNNMAHGDFVEPTTAEDADDVLDFMSVLLAEVYQLPAQVNARQSTRQARKAAVDARKAEAATNTA